MPHYPVLQPNGKLAVWSTIVDCFTALDCSVDDAAAEIGRWHSGDVRGACVSVAAGLLPFDHWKDWDVCLGWVLVSVGENDESVKYALSITPDQTAARLYADLIRTERAADDLRFRWDDLRAGRAVGSTL